MLKKMLNPTLKMVEKAGAERCFQEFSNKPQLYYEGESTNETQESIYPSFMTFKCNDMEQNDGEYLSGQSRTTQGYEQQSKNFEPTSNSRNAFMGVQSEISTSDKSYGKSVEDINNVSGSHSTFRFFDDGKTDIFQRGPPISENTVTSFPSYITNPDEPISDIEDSTKTQSVFTDGYSGYCYSDTNTSVNGNQSNLTVCCCTEPELHKVTSYTSLDTSIPTSSSQFIESSPKSCTTNTHSAKPCMPIQSFGTKYASFGSGKYQAEKQNANIVGSDQNQPTLQMQAQGSPDILNPYSTTRFQSSKIMSLDQVVRIRGLHTSPANYVFASPDEDGSSSIGIPNSVPYGVPLLPENMQPEQESDLIVHDTNLYETDEQFENTSSKNPESVPWNNLQKQVEFQYGLSPRTSYTSRACTVPEIANKPITQVYSTNIKDAGDNIHTLSTDRSLPSAGIVNVDSPSLDVSSVQYSMASGKAQYRCVFCGRIYTRHSRLKKHFLTKHSGKRFVFRCNVCFKTYTSKENLNRHMNIHTGKYKCPKCGSTHDRAKRFRQHLLQCLGKTTDLSHSSKITSA